MYITLTTSHGAISGRKVSKRWDRRFLARPEVSFLRVRLQCDWSVRWDAVSNRHRKPSQVTVTGHRHR